MPTRPPAALRVLRPPGNRSGKPRADQASAVYCTKTHAPRQPFARRRSPLAARLHPFWGHVTRSTVSSKSSATRASPRYRQYSSTASVGASGRPRSAMTRCPLILNCSFFDEKASDRQRVHARAEKCPYRIGRRVHDCFPAQIERSVHDNGHARAFSEFIDQPPVEWIDLFLDGLRPRASVHVRDGRNYAAFFRAHLRRQNHEWRIRCALQVFARRFLLDGRRKRPPPLAEFHRIVDSWRSFPDRADRRGSSGFPARAGQTPCVPETRRVFFPVPPLENCRCRSQC